MDNDKPTIDQKTRLSPFNIFMIGVALILLSGLIGGILNDIINWSNDLPVGEPTSWIAFGLILLGSWVLFFIDEHLGLLVLLIGGLVYAIIVWVGYGLSVWLTFVAMGLVGLLLTALINRVITRL